GVRDAVYDYFEGQGERSEERLSRAFAVDHARMTWVQKDDDGTEAVTSVPISEIIPRWSEGEPSGEARDSEILSMEIVDGRIATVMFDSNGRFYDALTLAKVNGEWKIISKAFVRQ
ncbi:MAG: nuclear transport factor 2 family protein, partial [Pseudomonadota bacterium]